jgi:hypothetical protein
MEQDQKYVAWLRLFFIPFGKGTEIAYKRRFQVEFASNKNIQASQSWGIRLMQFVFIYARKAINSIPSALTGAGKVNVFIMFEPATLSFREHECMAIREKA